MDGFQGALHKIRMNEKLNPEIRKKLEEIFAVSQSHAISSWVSELLDGRREITEEELKKIDERYGVVERMKKELKFDEEEETPSEKKKTIPVKKPSLREEAIAIAVKLEDKELAKYLEKAPMKSIQRRIKALREEVERMNKKQSQKSPNLPKKSAKEKR